jgi:shikimate kinase
MDFSMNIYLVGYRCTGKTSVGKLLAKQTGWSFVDADRFLVEYYGMTVDAIVSEKGWADFRQRERWILKKLHRLDRHVISTGGGVILDKKNRQRIRKSGVAIWLKASTETILQRIRGDAASHMMRPSLTGRSLADEVAETMAEREPLYRETGEIEITTDKIEVHGVCADILAKVGNRLTAP